MSTTIPRAIIRIFNSEDSRTAAFKEDVEVLEQNQMEHCQINHTKFLINLGGIYYAYRSPKMGRAVEDMPIDKIELCEEVSDVLFIAAAMASLTSTKLALSVGVEKSKSGLLLK